MVRRDARRRNLSTSQVALTLERRLLGELDALAEARVGPDRSQVIEAALADVLVRRGRIRLASGCATLDPREKRAARPRLR